MEGFIVKIGISEVLVLASCIFSFSNLTLACVSLSLGVLGGLVRYTISYSEKQQKVKNVENAAENFSSIISNIASGINKENLH